MYSARITRQNPTAFIFLIDRSGSMEERMTFGDTVVTKAEAVATVTNMLIRELINRCRKEDGIMDYFEIAAVGYSGDRAEMLLGTDNALVKPSALAHANVRKKMVSRELVLPDGTSVISNSEIKYWIEPGCEGNTPMRSALEKALALASRWCRKPGNRSSYPPTVFNITDGEATDGDYDMLTELASEIKSLGTDDGNVLLMNINISSGLQDATVLFPDSKNDIPASRYADMLYDMSSVMPAEYDESILAIKNGGRPPFRAMGMNTSASGLIDMMNIGSRSINRIL